MTVISVLLVASMVIQKNRSDLPVWKNSTLAVLLYSVAGWRPTTSVLEGPSALKNEAQSISVTLCGDREELEFVRKLEIS